MADKKSNNTNELGEIKRILFTLDHVTNALNTACLALAYCIGVKGDELDKVNGDELVKFTQEHMHPLIRRADQIVRDVSEMVSKSAKEAIDEPTKEEFEEAVPVDHVEPLEAANSEEGANGE